MYAMVFLPTNGSTPYTTFCLKHIKEILCPTFYILHIIVIANCMLVLSHNPALLTFFMFSSNHYQI